ncbi:MAG: hypothetical protein KBS81_02585 [Spirochaetales bacterium]|nr:hypothetical protein [Candidatus Physcosoma equi]
MINFTVGPVQASDEILSIGSEQVPYFRTPEFSSLMKENERMMLEFADAPEKSRVVFLTGSGTAAMESTVMNLFREDDSLLVINGGSFGARFCQICDVHHYHYEAIRLSPGKTLTKEVLDA